MSIFWFFFCRNLLKVRHKDKPKPVLTTPQQELPGALKFKNNPPPWVPGRGIWGNWSCSALLQAPLNLSGKWQDLGSSLPWAMTVLLVPGNAKMRLKKGINHSQDGLKKFLKNISDQLQTESWVFKLRNPSKGPKKRRSQGWIPVPGRIRYHSVPFLVYFDCLWVLKIIFILKIFLIYYIFI